MSSVVERRDLVVAEVIAAGGVVHAMRPLATIDDPHTVAAYQFDIGAPSEDVLAALAAVREMTEVATAGLIPWSAAPVEAPVEGD